MTLKTRLLLGAMTPMEMAKGRYMRAPDHPEARGDDFDNFVADDGKKIETGEKVSFVETTPNAPAADDGDEDPKPNDGDGEGDDEDDEKPKPKAKKTPQERVKESRAEVAKVRREAAAERAAFEERIARLEKGLPAGTTSDNSNAGAAPDPSDQDKYPLGHLDDRYIEDKLEWLAETKAAARAEAALQRQQRSEQETAVTQAQEALLETVNTVADRGLEHYDDFQETVVDAGMRGDYDLSQATFEAAAEADFGAQILYALATDKKEASRVAKLSNYQQTKYVFDKNAELSGAAPKPRTKPGAVPPPENLARGNSSRNSIRADTDNLDDFGKAWEKAARR